MAAPLKNQNHLKYPPARVKELFTKAIKAIQSDEEIFNYPCLHRAINLKTLRTLPYLANMYKNNPELMKLWEKVKSGLEENLQKRIEKFYGIEFIQKALE